MIIFLHGFLGNPEDWSKISEYLSTPHQALTLPGHNHVPLADDINHALRQKISEPVTLVGYSLGGRLALDFATSFPELVEKLIILSANPGIDSKEKRQERKKWDEAWCELIDKQGFPAFLKKWYEQPLFHTFQESPDFAHIFNKRLQESPAAMKEVFLRLSPAILPSYWEAIKKFSFPTLFLFGEHDIKYQSVKTRLQKMGVKTDLIPNSGHAIHLENPSVCAQKIKEFL